MPTIAVVEFDTETEFTVMPVPKYAVVVPFTKWVERPVTVTYSVCAS